jgi:alanine racemase
MSHFACSEKSIRSTRSRWQRFRAVRALFPGIAGSLANSSGIFLGPTAHHDLVRPGVALYGANPTPGKPNPMQRSLRCRAHRAAPSGRARRDRRLQRDLDARAPTVSRRSVGYADGFLARASASDRGAAPTRSSPGSAARSPGASRWT